MICLGLQLKKIFSIFTNLYVKVLLLNIPKKQAAILIVSYLLIRKMSI